MTLTTSFANGISRPAHARGLSWWAFFGASMLLFIVSTAATVLWCGSMSAMGDMPMPGGWTMSMAWMRMPGATWVGAVSSFVGMWALMMVAMMLPSLTPMLWRYRHTKTGIVALGYFFVWTLVGLAIFPVGAAIAAVEMEHAILARAVPMATGLVLVIAGAVQTSKWKADRLSYCREEPTGTAWRQGFDMGIRCALSCANLTAVLFVLGVMNLHAMAAVTAAITAERLVPAGRQVSQAIGFIVAGAGLILIARAAGLR